MPDALSLSRSELPEEIATGSIVRGLRYKLEPTLEQEFLFRQFAGACRFVYNIALEQRRDWWRNYARIHGCQISARSQSAEVTALRSHVDWLAEVPRSCLEQALRDLDKAYKNFFARRSGYPKPRSKARNTAFRFQGREVSIRSLNAKWSEVRLPKIGWTKFRASRAVRGKILDATVSLGPLGWEVSLTCEIAHETPSAKAEWVGIDRGVATTLALSTGDLLTLPSRLEQVEAQSRRARRVADRRERGSNRRRKALKRVASLQARQARMRRSFHHQASLEIAERFGVAVLEDLATKNMTASGRGTIAEPGRNVRQKAGLNRVILNAGWHQFKTILRYKMEERGGRVITVPAAYTSQTCSACGVIDARSRKNQAVFECVSCGHRDHADTNAAIEILRRGSTSSLRVEGSGHGPVEARTMAARERGLNPAAKAAGGC